MRSATASDFAWPNFGFFYRDVVARYADRVAFRYRCRGKTAFDEWSYERLGAEGSALASCILSRGLKRGDRVIIWSENRPEWGAAYFALVAAGLVAVPVDVLLPADDVGRIVKAAEPAAVIASRSMADRLPEALAGCAGQPSPAALLVVGLDGKPGAGTTGLSWTDAVAEGRVAAGGGAGAMPDPATIEPDTLASLIFTSGTTGKPKAVMLAHRGIIANIAASIEALPIDGNDVFVCVLPLHHTYPTTCTLLSPLAVGASVTICEKVIGKVIIDDARDTGGTVVIGVPILFDKLAQGLAQGIKAKGGALRALVGFLLGLSRLGLGLGMPGIGRALLRSVRSKAGLGSIRLLVSGGGPLSASTAMAFEELGFTIVQGYGMSENGPLISTNRIGKLDHRSAGIAVTETLARIAEPDAEGVGEIQVRSPSLMKGYWRDPEETARAFTEDGWLRTGDLGRIDGRGFIYITGRIKSLIVTAGGKNIYPEEIESRFDGSRVVKEILVVGKRAPGPEAAGAAEEVAAAIVPDLESIAADRGPELASDLSSVSELVKEEVERVNRSLPLYKKISEFSLRASEFEKTSSKKIKRYLYRTWESAKL